MANLNRVLIIGNCVRDPEVRYTPKQTAVAEISVAAKRTWKNENGDRQEEVTYVDCTLWGRLAEIAGQYLKKGRPVFIEGRLQYSTWEKDGQKHSRLKVIAENLQLLGSRQDSEAASPGTARPAGTPASKAPVVTGGFEPEDIPFGCDRG